MWLAKKGFFSAGIGGLYCLGIFDCVHYFCVVHKRFKNIWLMVGYLLGGLALTMLVCIFFLSIAHALENISCFVSVTLCVPS